MNAWLISWEGDGEHAQVVDPFIGILGGNTSISEIVSLIETYYLFARSSAKDMLYYADRPQIKPFGTTILMPVSAFQKPDRIICGDKPHIYARLVSELEVELDTKKGTELLTWREPKPDKHAEVETRRMEKRL